MDDYPIVNMDGVGISGDWTKTGGWDIFFNNTEEIVDQFIRIMCGEDQSPENVRRVMNGWVEYMPSAKTAPDELVDAMLLEGLIDRDPRL